MADLFTPAFQEQGGVRLWMAQDLDGEHASEWLQAGAAGLAARAEATGAGREFGRGRGAARALTIGGKPAVWRQNRHGGALGDWLGDRYLSSVRLAREVALSSELRREGVDTPQVLLAIAERQGLFLRQHLVTEEVVGARTVFDARDDAQALAAADALLERVFDLGLWATDLHPANLLWQPEADHPEGGRCWIIDLAGAAMRVAPLRPQERAARRARFARYFQKHAGAVPALFQV